MSFQEVNALRKEGRLDEAYELAQADIQNAETGDIWSKRGMSWVLIAFLKQNASYNQKNDFLRYLREFAELEVSSEENMVYENIKYWLVKFSFSAVNQNFLDSTLLNNYTELYKELKITKPSELHSKTLAALLKKQDWQGLFSFIQWWDLNNLRAEDFQEEEYNGRKLMSLAERSYIVFGKELVKH